MSIAVYYTQASDLTPRSVFFEDGQMSEALAKCQGLRASGFIFVTMVAELSGQVGTADPGGAVSGGKLPNGNDYEWSKSHRAGAKPQKEVIKK